MLSPNQAASFAPRFPSIAADAALEAAVVAQATAVSLSGGRQICGEGDACSHLALVTDGAARVYKLAESGREITLYRVEPGECCILTASCMLSGRPFPAHATVESEVRAILVPQARVLEWMTAYPAWRHFLWGLLAERLADVIGLVEEVAFRRMDERLAAYLVQQVRERGPTLLATHQQIAADLGTSREVISRMLKDFQLRGWLSLARGRIEVDDLDSLAAIAPLGD